MDPSINLASFGADFGTIKTRVAENIYEFSAHRNILEACMLKSQNEIWMLVSKPFGPPIVWYEDQDIQVKPGEYYLFIFEKDKEKIQQEQMIAPLESLICEPMIPEILTANRLTVFVDKERIAKNQIIFYNHNFISLNFKFLKNKN